MLEKDFVDKVEKFLIENGCTTEREVIPDECKHWNKPYRVDLIFKHPTKGIFGIEAKSINSLRKGGLIARAFEQTKRYTTFNYNGEKIKRWALLIHTNRCESTSIGKCYCEVMYFIRNWLKFYGISLMEIDYKDESYDEIKRICLDVNTKESVYFYKEDGSFIV